MPKRLWTILFIMLCAGAVSATPAHIIIKGNCPGTKCSKHLKCAADSGLKAKCVTITPKKVQAKKPAKDESKSIFSGLLPFEFPKLPLEDFILSAQKALAEKLF
jgi:hypothetical protein